MPIPCDSNPELGDGCAQKVSRRTFGRRTAVLAVLSLTPGSLLVESQAGTANRREQNTEPQQGTSGLTPEQTTEVEAKLANLIRQFGDRLTAEQRTHLRRILTYNEKMLVSIRSFPLQNGDPPSSVLKLALPQPLRQKRE